jgi:hypothetical protein
MAFVADEVFPIIDSPSPEAKIGKYSKGAWFRDEAGIRAPGTRAKRGGYTVTTSDIVALEYAFAKEVTDEDVRDAKLSNTPPMQPAQDAIEFCTMKIDLKKEVRVAAIMKGTTWSGANNDAEGGWAQDAGTNTFIVDIETAIDTIQSNTGFRPNRLMLTSNTYSHIKQISGVIDRIKYTQRGVVAADTIAALFDLERVVIAGAIQNTAKETKAATEFTAARIWETTAAKGSAFLYYKPPALGLKTPIAGMQVRVPYENGQMRRVVTWREEAEHQDVYEVAENTDIECIGADLGYYFYDTILT